jgi:hypothetical protein
MLPTLRTCTPPLIYDKQSPCCDATTHANSSVPEQPTHHRAVPIIRHHGCPHCSHITSYWTQTPVPCSSRLCACSATAHNNSSHSSFTKPSAHHCRQYCNCMSQLPTHMHTIGTKRCCFVSQTTPRCPAPGRPVSIYAMLYSSACSSATRSFMTRCHARSVPP